MTLDAVRARVNHIVREELHLNADAAAKGTDEYIKFMKLKVEQPEAALAPSHAVDQVWHNHILDTRSYQELQAILMPNGGFIHHNPVLSEQPFYEMRYANTLSLLTKKYGETLDADSWPIDNFEYKKINIMVTVNGNKKAVTAGPQVYCYKQQTVLQLVDTVKLVMCYTARDRIIISGMNIDYLPKSTQRVSQTVLWRSAAVRVSVFGSCASDNHITNTRGDTRVSHLCFEDETAAIEVNTCIIMGCTSIPFQSHKLIFCYLQLFDHTQ
jgi:hypothetical protein